MKHLVYEFINKFISEIRALSLYFVFPKYRFWPAKINVSRAKNLVAILTDSVRIAFPIVVTQRQWFESFKPLMIDNFEKQTFTITVLVQFRLLNYQTSTILFNDTCSVHSMTIQLQRLIQLTGRTRTTVNNILEQYLFKLHLKTVLLRNVF